MKIFINKINENWIVDKLKQEFVEEYPKITTKNILKANIVWIMSPWTWNNFYNFIIKKKKVICTIHHIDESKFDKNKFLKLDSYVDYYHVISKKTLIELEKYTNKKIFYNPWWINNKFLFHIENKSKLREEFGIDSNKFLVGSFQRDTEGSDLISPKLIKGPDIFVDYILKLSKEVDNLEVVLTGKRRQFVISQLKKNNIPFHFFEMVSTNEMNKLYNLLNLYIVTSRVEGGPQAIFECAITKTPIISSDVGIANEVLHSKSIFRVEPSFEEINNAQPDVDYAYNKVQKYLISSNLLRFKKIFEEIDEN